MTLKNLPTASFRAMTLFDDFADFFNRHTILANNLEKTNWPQYDIINIDNNKKRINVGLGGANFNKDDLKVSIDKDHIMIKGHKEKKEVEESVNYLYNGLAKRNFELKFPLLPNNDYDITDCTYENGLLSILVEWNAEQNDKFKLIEIK